MRNLSYTSRLEMLGLERLETRRFHDMVRSMQTLPYMVRSMQTLPCATNIVHNLVDIPFDEFFKYICKKTYQFKIHCKDDVMISLH